MGLHLIAPHTGDFHTLPLCSIKNVNLTWAVHDVQNIAQKDVISATDLEAAIRVVNQALQVRCTE
jgi:pterin-4a-carbinolamine dehydratase